MGLVARLDRWSKEFDKIRWQHEGYDCDAVELSDLLKEAARTLRGFHHLFDQVRRVANE